MSACIPTYQLASGLIDSGMNWGQGVVTIFLGNLIVLLPMILNAHAGTKFGIPFPVYCRASFGTYGANIPAMMRALVACGWFGIQAWIGGGAIFSIVAVYHPSVASLGHAAFLGITAPQFGCFMIFWAINVIVILAGIESIRILLNIKAPLLIALGLLLLAWAYRAAHGFGPMLHQKGLPTGSPAFWKLFWPSLTAMVGFWATLSLNIPDFSRYAKTQRDQIVGQAIGLPTTMGLYSFIGVAVTSATVVIYGKTIWDPIQLLQTFKSPGVIVFSMVAIALATLATNIAANVVSPANDIANLAPRFIGFRLGGVIAAVVGVLIMPWKLIADPHGYIFIWLVGYSGLLGAVGGILICDYWILRRCKLDVNALYDPNGRYAYTRGINWIAVIVFIVAVIPCVPGFLAQASGGRIVILKSIHYLYTYSWFVTFGIALVLYFFLMLIRRMAAGRDA
jgi:NCS1 family nucleobase:cation symporter-1